MGNTEIVKKLEELQELKRMREDIDAAIESAQDSIKAAMGDTETATYGPFKVTWKTVVSTRVDTTALKKELPEIAARYSKTYESRPFKVT